jgi:radical SAM protein with 4Fe4S-binding SPASM domain
MTTMLQADRRAASRAGAKDYQRAVELLGSGRVQAGANLMGRVAQETEDDGLRSQALFGLAEVLEQLGDLDRAYATWHGLAHKPVALRNKFDTLARRRVMALFEKHALRLSPPDFPPRLQLEITNRCNLRCVMCTRNQMDRGLGDMAFETLRRAADEWCVETGCVMALYFLGEPLLHKELERLIAYLAKAGDRAPGSATFGIQTNGMLMTRERSRALIEAGLREVSISLDGLEGDLEVIRPGASYPIIETNIHDLIDVAAEMGVDDLVVNITKLSEDFGSEETRRFLDRWQGKVSNVLLSGITKVEGNSYMSADRKIEYVMPTVHPRRRAYCRHGNRLLVYWNGDFGFCCGDVNGKLPLGNIHDRTVRDVWNSPEIQRIRDKVLAADYKDLTACQTCPNSYG